MIKLSLENGAKAAKICGAGGGGCVLVWADPSRHAKLAEVWQKNAFQPRDYYFNHKSWLG
ncbi:MAG: hypothetical protein AAB243_05265, partial [Planctomycetota bacterium]